MYVRKLSKQCRLPIELFTELKKAHELMLLAQKRGQKDQYIHYKSRWQTLAWVVKEKAE